MRLILAFLPLFVAATGQSQSLRDYSLMTHRIFIDSLRAGNHDESGENEYYFVYKMQSVRNKKEDMVKELSERPTINQEPKIFGEVKIPVLSQWQPTTKNPDEDLFLDIDGNEIRAVVAAAMREFKVKENEVSMVGVLEMWERNKLFGYFGDDYKVGEVRYFPIPASEYHAAARTNLKLMLDDDKGTLVTIKVRYDSPRTPASSAPSASEKPNTESPAPISTPPKSESQAAP